MPSKVYCSFSVMFLLVRHEENNFRIIKHSSGPLRNVCILGKVDVVTAVV